MTNPGNADETPPPEEQGTPSQTGAGDAPREAAAGGDQASPTEQSPTGQPVGQSATPPWSPGVDAGPAYENPPYPPSADAPSPGFAPLDYPGGGPAPYPPAGYAPPTGFPPGSDAGTQYPGAQYPGPQYPGSPSPADQQPAPQYPGSQYPGSQYPGSQYPGSQYPGSQYSGAQFPGAQYPPAQYGQPGVPAPPYGAAPYGPPPGYPDPNYYGYTARPTTNTLSIWSLVVALVGFPFLLTGILAFVTVATSIAGIVLGMMAVNQIKTTGENGRGLAIGGIATGAALLIVIVLAIVLVLILAATTSSGSI